LHHHQLVGSQTVETVVGFKVLFGMVDVAAYFAGKEHPTTDVGRTMGQRSGGIGGRE
jgi:hypothetical protein